MRPISAQQLSEILGVSVVSGNAEVMIVGGVTTDTRKLPHGSVFFALRGENFNGDWFAEKALAGGAVVAVVQHWEGVTPAGTAVIVVPDTLGALQRLASWWRNCLEIPIVAITGSNGKTSTKDFTAAVLSRQFRVAATLGNLNNHIGLPLTILATTFEHGAAVWEMGMNHSGEIAPLCEIAQPLYGIITNLGSAHIEFLGTLDAIAEEKGMLARSLPADGTLFFPECCGFDDCLRKWTKAHVIAVGGEQGVVRAENLRFEADRTLFSMLIEGHDAVEVILPVPGRHMVMNALLAAGVGAQLGICPSEIAIGLSNVSLSGGRLGRYEHHGISIIDDTYNANPESMAAAIETLANTPIRDGARRIMVLGRMGELGIHALAAHLKIGASAIDRNLTVIAVGAGSEGIAEGANNAPHFSDLEHATQWLMHEVKPGDVVLFKGSRSATVERVMYAAFPKD
jgi:UDP-N-acetylmuramoyl-tripeptide--D-alanyl-D-alanine ligase